MNGKATRPSETMPGGILRVFPRRTKATPDDRMAFVGEPPLFRPVESEAREVHVSCAFTWDRHRTRSLAHAWHKQYPKATMQIGGPGLGAKGAEFVPGMYLKQGYTITTRGCPNHCWFCLVPKREGPLRELPIQPGWDILDNNLLAASRKHIEAVMGMLGEQPKAARFSGGIDARLVESWWAKLVAGLRLDILYTAYDQPRQRDAVERAVKMLRDAGLRQRRVGCYVLVGQNEETQAQAWARLQWVFEIGAMPFAMYYRPETERQKRIPPDWRAFVRRWARPAAIFAAAEAAT